MSAVAESPDPKVPTTCREVKGGEKLWEQKARPREPQKVYESAPLTHSMGGGSGGKHASPDDAEARGSRLLRTLQLVGDGCRLPLALFHNRR